MAPPALEPALLGLDDVAGEDAGVLDGALLDAVEAVDGGDAAARELDPAVGEVVDAAGVDQGAAEREVVRPGEGAVLPDGPLDVVELLLTLYPVG